MKLTPEDQAINRRNAELFDAFAALDYNGTAAVYARHSRARMISRSRTKRFIPPVNGCLNWDIPII